ncbi:uncharacterized protein BX663DRAFT_464446 [Cokeromyces recurvatus]|uniref:uncharacterized protein n=1 Tax=Cokeromyces recurvatus TaxID=90255 RepID=UPI00221EB5CD|nr:uncharacterized protein BX663DRAFT_464446 [Cokeromyces recurvatus]KAI7907970.1 hypothetical protein BX663DRAFT_464446 [Cokeromyces recurvatus]
MQVHKRIFFVIFTLCGIVLSNIIYPTTGITWEVGQSVNMILDSGQAGETVSIFFNNDRDTILAGGPIDKGNVNSHSFQFTVPLKALSSAGGLTELLVVHRISGYLSSVDTVLVKIIL